MKQNLLSLSVLWVAINIKHRHLVGLFLRWWLLVSQLFMFSLIHFVSKNMIYFLCFPLLFFPPSQRNGNLLDFFRNLHLYFMKSWASNHHHLRYNPSKCLRLKVSETQRTLKDNRFCFIF